MNDQASRPLDSPLEMIWQAGAILWMVASGEGLALLLALSPAADQVDRGTYFAFLSFFIQWVLLLTLSLLYLGRRFLLPLRPLQIGNVAIVVLIVSAMVASLMIGLAYGSLLDERTSRYFDLRIATSIAITSGVIGLAVFHAHWRSRQMAIRAKQAELDALRARVNPHFLFNTLNIASALVHARPAQAEAILLDLSDLFRAALSERREHTVADELALVQRYLEIETLRLGDRLQVELERPDPLPTDMLPVLSLQPLVENAVRHGIEALAEGGRVRISVSASPSELLLRVSNPIPDQPSMQSNGHQVGLAATCARIESFSAGAGRLQTRVERGEFIAEIILPRHATNA